MPIIRSDGTARIKVIQPGAGSSGHYLPEMLKRDGPKVFTKGTHLYINHQTAQEESQRPEGSVHDLAGVFKSNAQYEEKGSSGPGLYADIEVFKPFRPLLEELAPHIGVSIRAFGTAKEGEIDGKKTRVVDSLIAAKSVDFVTKAGAGGRFEELLESARTQVLQEAKAVPGQTHKEKATMEIEEKELQGLRKAKADTERLRKRLIISDAREAVRTELSVTALPPAAKERLIERLASNPPEKDGDLDSVALKTQITAAVEAETNGKVASVNANVDRLQKRLIMAEARVLVQTELNAATLPSTAKLRLIESLIENPPEKDGDLDGAALKTRITAAVEEEAKYIASVTGSPVRGMGTAALTETLKEADFEKEMTALYVEQGMTPAAAAIAAKGVN